MGKLSAAIIAALALAACGGDNQTFEERVDGGSEGHIKRIAHGADHD